MNNTKKIIASYLKAREDIRGQIEALTRVANSAREDLEKILAGDGWRKFEFFSSYYGSHGEFGEGDEEATFYFHPSVDLSAWSETGFSHGHYGQSESSARFFHWISFLDEGLYVEVG